ncbi:MAG TPA: endolytic transglycosylase MltG, partial [Ktedonobacterales bacterium]|nr:endolytic transglycosylase MltG [Ktedonobacterales bacterium]
LALYDTLIIASLTAREIDHFQDATGVASTLHNRYLAALGQVQSDSAGYLGADPTAQYARDTDTPPQDGHWWKPLADAGSKIATSNPYNTDAVADPSHRGLPPGPIAAPAWPEIVAAATPHPPAQWPYFYFAMDRCGTTHYAKTGVEFNANVVPKLQSGNCP